LPHATSLSQKKFIRNLKQLYLFNFNAILFFSKIIIFEKKSGKGKMDTGKALEIWTAQTILDIGILFSIISALLHIGRPYFERIQARLTLRVAADIWWLLYIVLRDGLLFFSVLFIFLSMNLDIMADIKVGLPFVPLGFLLLITALSFKVFRNTEDVNKISKRNNYIIAAGALLNLLGYVLVMEAPGDEYSAAHTSFWSFMVSLRSNANPELSTITFYFTFAVLIAAFLFVLFYYSKHFEKDKGEDVRS
jgi:hypothetical protein